jgi:hypothetical protein
VLAEATTQIIAISSVEKPYVFAQVHIKLLIISMIKEDMNLVETFSTQTPSVQGASFGYASTD